MKPLELWGGLECTVNRTREGYYDQLTLCGHDRRSDDIELIAELGFKSLRYPVLWERTQPRPDHEPDWSCPDDRLTALRACGITPIIGLVHHGSGPAQTDLSQHSFLEGLAAYALEVAKRYPWIENYTPVNEPLTTARFSGLYGFWHPHHSDAAAFCRMLLNQCRATALAMQAIRRINPRARLVQTDDLGCISSTPHMRYQADFENERRWLTWDLLTGRVGRTHPLFQYFRDSGIADSEILWLQDHPCPPDVIGINYYITSERFLDERTQLYPEWSLGGNGRDTYADVEAVRVLPEGISGIGRVIHEAWRRYGIPVAVTEAHLGGPPEDQICWFREIWTGAIAARETGVPVEAVTSWALLGSFDWNSLLTRRVGHYEPGAFDVSTGRPIATPLATYLQSLSTPLSPTLLEATGGWWYRPERLLYASV